MKGGQELEGSGGEMGRRGGEKKRGGVRGRTVGE